MVGERAMSDAARLAILLGGDVAALLEVIARTDVESLRLEDGDVAIKVGRAAGSGTVVPGTSAVGIATGLGPVGSDPAPKETAGPVPLRSLSVGFFHRSRAEGAPNLVEDGAAIEPGTVVAVVETLGMAGEVISSTAGTLEFAIEDGHPVGYGEVLAVIHPA